jgi:membrane fusion protein (multidrug efflux system)
LERGELVRYFLLAAILAFPTALAAQDVTAVLEPAQSVELRSTVNGRVVSITDLEGTMVQAGDVIAEIDGSVQRARVALTQIAAEATGTVERARTLLTQAEFRRDRLANALKKGAAQSWEVEVAEQAVAVAEADLTVAKDDQDRRAAELALEQATLSEFEIRAPFDATVLDVVVDPGEIVDTATVLVEVGALDTLLATAFVPLEWVPELPKTGAIAASFESGARADVVIRAIDPRVDPASRTVRVIVEIANEEGLLRPGEILTLRDPR